MWPDVKPGTGVACAQIQTPILAHLVPVWIGNVELIDRGSACAGDFEGFEIRNEMQVDRGWEATSALLICNKVC